MAITVSSNALITIDGVDFTDHCVQMTVNDGQESKEVTHLRSSVRNYRSAMGTASIDCTFLNDSSSGSIAYKLASCLLMANNPPTAYSTTKMTAALAGLGAGNLLAGAYLYYHTNVFPAFESAPTTSYATATVVSSGSNGQIALTSIPLSTAGTTTGLGGGYCKARNIYRTQQANGSSSTCVLLTTIADNTTTTYTDNTSSSSLVSAAAMPQTWTVTGFNVTARKVQTAQSTNNPTYTLSALIDGAVNLADDKPGEIPQIKVKFTPFGTFTVNTSAT